MRNPRRKSPLLLMMNLPLFPLRCSKFPTCRLQPGRSAPEAPPSPPPAAAAQFVRPDHRGGRAENPPDIVPAGDGPREPVPDDDGRERSVGQQSDVAAAGYARYGTGSECRGCWWAAGSTATAAAATPVVEFADAATGAEFRCFATAAAEKVRILSATKLFTGMVIISATVG